MIENQLYELKLLVSQGFKFLTRYGLGGKVVAHKNLPKKTWGTYGLVIQAPYFIMN